MGEALKTLRGGGVNIKDATATAADVLLGKTFYAGTDKAIKTGLGDANLIAENIKSGVSIFGVAGSLTGNSLLKFATGVTDTNPGTGASVRVSGLGFTPIAVVIYGSSRSGFSILTSASDAISGALYGEGYATAMQTTNGTATTYFGPGWFSVRAVSSTVSWGKNNTWYAIGF